MKKIIVRKDAYYDSVTLMSLSSKISEMDGVLEAVISMATDINKELVKDMGLLTEESEDADASDMLIAISAEDEDSYNRAIEMMEEELTSGKKQKSRGEKKPPKSIEEALEDIDANLALISVPGRYAAREARIALENDMHVMIFSDNVGLEDERRLKEIGREKGLLVMGPDCGTASINNVGLCFANKVRKGNIGIVGASGTGLQEIMVQIHRLGGGVSQAIGTGGRDLQKQIGGIMMIEGLKALNQDDQTDIIVLVSKPPAKEIEEKILEEIKNIKKEVVVCFLDGDKKDREVNNSSFVYSLYDAARSALKLAKVDIAIMDENRDEKIEKYKDKLTRDQKYFRGLFCGGTLCSEAMSITREGLGRVKSNVAKLDDELLEDFDHYKGNVLLDLGEDEFTSGRPHPMIEPSLRNPRIIKEAKDKEVGIILLDFELGYGAHDDPIGVNLKAIKEAQAIARSNNREIIFLAYICGSDMDKQGYEGQRKALEDNGVIVANSNMEAANMVVDLLA